MKINLFVYLIDGKIRKLESEKRKTIQDSENERKIQNQILQLKKYRKIFSPVYWIVFILLLLPVIVKYMPHGNGGKEELIFDRNKDFIRCSGIFLMGCIQDAEKCQENELPRQKVTVSKSFWIGKYEVTQKQWESVMGYNPSQAGKGDEYPVDSVTWNEVRGFIKKLNDRFITEGVHFRLPSEKEWELACRSMEEEDENIYAGGNHPDPFAWYYRKHSEGTHPVASKKPNGIGIFDMNGNVWEWTQDEYRSTYADSPVPGSAAQGCNENPDIFRTIRGGGWADNKESVTCSSRSGENPGEMRDDIGFRLIMED